MHSIDITMSFCRVITQRAKDKGQEVTPFWGGQVGGGHLG